MLMTFLLAGLLSADTVMVYLKDAEAGDFIAGGLIEMATAVEDGVMAEFFDSGHIVFNYGISTRVDSSPMPFKAEEPAIRSAKSGGASIILVVRLFPKSGELPIPDGAEYELRDLIDERILIDGTVNTSELETEDDDSTDPRQMCMLLGRTVARYALRGL